MAARLAHTDQEAAAASEQEREALRRQLLPSSKRASSQRTAAANTRVRLHRAAQADASEECSSGSAGMCLRRHSRKSQYRGRHLPEKLPVRAMSQTCCQRSYQFLWFAEGDGAAEAEHDAYDPASDPEVARTEASEGSTSSDGKAVSDADSQETVVLPARSSAQRAQHGVSRVMQPGLGDDALPSDADLAAMGMDADEWQLQRAMALSMEAGSPAGLPPSDPQGTGREDCLPAGHCSGGAGDTPGPSSKPAAADSGVAAVHTSGPPAARPGRHAQLDASQSPGAGAAGAQAPKRGGAGRGAGRGSPAAGAAGAKAAKGGGSGPGKVGTKKRRRGGLQASDEELDAAFAIVASGRSHVTRHSIVQARNLPM